MQDQIGHQTLEVMAGADHYNKWIYSLIKPYISGRVAEVGAGTGTFSQIIANDGHSVTAIDYNSEYLKIINNKNNKIETCLFDMQSRSLPTALFGKFDTVVMLNVLEHLSDQMLAISHINHMLKKGGTMIALVPSFQFAYGTLDKHLGHFRRYTKNSLTKVITGSGFKVVTTRYINLLGLLGWALNSRLLKSKLISSFQVKIFDFVYRPFLMIEKYIPPPLGISLICVAKKS